MRKQKFWQTKKFKELEEEWEKNLEKAGFKDAEKTIKGVRVLKQRATNSYRSATLVTRENKLRYYELLGIHLHQEKFPNEAYKKIIELRSQGKKLEEISKVSRILNRDKNNKETIRRIIKRYEIKWGIKKKR